MDFLLQFVQIHFFSKTTQNRNSSNNYTTFVSIPYVQGVSEPIKRVLAQVGIEVALKAYLRCRLFFVNLKMLFVARKSVVLYMKFHVVIVTLFMLGKPDAV